MAYVQDFAATQVLGSPSVIYLEDTSTGSDGSITDRRVYITNAAGQYLTAGNSPSATPVYTTWLLANTTTTIDVLNVDMGLYIRVDWINVSGTVLYTKTTLYGFYQYTQSFLLQLTKNQSANPGILQDTNYWGDKANLHTLLKDAQNAISPGGDIYSCQNSLNLAQWLITNSKFFF